MVIAHSCLMGDYFITPHRWIRYQAKGELDVLGPLYQSRTAIDNTKHWTSPYYLNYESMTFYHLLLYNNLIYRKGDSYTFGPYIYHLK